MVVPPDIYKQDVDFVALAMRYPEFARKLKSNQQLDFSDPESVRQLTKALLHRDFHIVIDLPENRLCPPVPNRYVEGKIINEEKANVESFNYIRFVQQLLDSTQSNYREGYDPDRRIIGLDIGTGASAIYPLLACRQRPSWRFLATEIDRESRSYAQANIERNGLQSKIKIINTDVSGQTLLPLEELERFEHIDILLTNPPFYASETEMVSLANQKSRPSNSACTGSPVEMITPGGEVAFVSRLIEESKSETNREKFQWFSSMLGKLGSVMQVVNKLKEYECNNYAVTEFVQGQKTRRWCIAWSWRSLRAPSSVARGTNALEKKLLPFPTIFSFDIRIHTEAALVSKLNQEMSKLEMQWRWRDDIQTGICRDFKGDVWSRQARRKQKRTDTTLDTIDDDEAEPVLTCKIKSLPNAEQGVTRTEIHWLQGNDSILFESLCGWLKRKLEA